MTPDESRAWRPDIQGWSVDILPFYDRMARELPVGCRVVEVGAYHGRSVLFLTERLRAEGKIDYRAGQVEAVDSWDWHPHDGDTFDANRRAVLGDDWAFCFSHRAKSPECAKDFAAWQYDLVFIDGFHSYDEVKADVAAWRSKVKPGGILAGHDYGEPAWPGVKQAVDEAFPDGVTVEGTVWSVRL